jgi:hypothetical protein
LSVLAVFLFSEVIDDGIMGAIDSSGALLDDGVLGALVDEVPQTTLPVDGPGKSAFWRFSDGLLVVGTK